MGTSERKGLNMNNFSKWIFVCPKCGQHSVRLKKLTTWGYQNVCEQCDWTGVIAKETYLTEELHDAHTKTVVESED